MKGALFIHFWDFALRQMGLDAFRDPPSGSYWAEVIENCPNRLASDVGYHRGAEKTIRKFAETYWKPDRWHAFLENHPDLFSSAHACSAAGPTP